MMTELDRPARESDEDADSRVVYVVDDNHDFRESLVYLLQSVHLKVVDFATPAEFLQKFDPERAGCIMLDIRMPGMSGLDLHEQLVRQNVRTPVIIITAHGEVNTAVQAMKRGAIEYIEKTDSDQQVLGRVQSAMRVDAERRSRELTVGETLARYQQLTPREREILAQVATGRNSRQIADHLQELKQKTVEAHRARIMRKMEAPNVAGLVRMYLQLRQAGVVDDELDEIQIGDGDDDAADE